MTISEEDKLYDKACRLQREYSTNKSITYDKILLAFSEAASKGSFKAQQWVKDQAPSSIKANSLWKRPEGGLGGQVNNLHIDEINKDRS